MKNIDENNKELVKKTQRNIVSTYTCILKSQEKISLFQPFVFTKCFL